jgi:hypothetical protein
MKRNLICILLASMFAVIQLGAQAGPPPGTSQVFMAFTGGSVWTSDHTGTCIWYFPVLGDMPLTSLFATDNSGTPVINKEHAYFIWVSDWEIIAGGENAGFGGAKVSMAILRPGDATIYYSDNPTGRLWTDYSQRGTWGIPVAKFTRGAGLFQSPDGFAQTDRFIFSAQLNESRDVSLPDSHFNFRKLMPYGISCFEFGQNQSTTETGACIAMGK